MKRIALILLVAFSCTALAKAPPPKNAQVVKPAPKSVVQPLPPSPPLGIVTPKRPPLTVEDDDL